MHKQRIAIIVVAAIGLIAVFLPWATMSFMGLSESFNLMDLSDLANLATMLGESPSWVFSAGPWIMILASIVAIGLAIAMGDRNEPVVEPFKFGVAAAGVILALMPILIFVNEVMAELRGDPTGSTGFGLFLAIFAGIVVAVIPFLDPEMFNKIGGSKPSA